MAHRNTHDPETRARLANVLSLAHQGTPERAWRFALCRCDRDSGKLEVVKRCLAQTRDEAVAFFGRISPEMFVASMASLSVTGVMPVGKAEFRGRRA